MINRLLTQIVAKSTTYKVYLYLPIAKTIKANCFYSKSINFFVFGLTNHHSLSINQTYIFTKPQLNFLANVPSSFVLTKFMGVTNIVCLGLVLLRKQFHYPSGMFTRQAATINFSEQITESCKKINCQKA